MIYADEVNVGFIAQPENEVICSTGEVAQFSCSFNDSYLPTSWIINSAMYSIDHLPPNNTFVNGTLSVKNISMQQNNSRYQCQLVIYTYKPPAGVCSLNSTVGVLTLNSKDKYCMQSPTQNTQNHHHIIQQKLTVRHENAEYLKITIAQAHNYNNVHFMCMVISNNV